MICLGFCRLLNAGVQEADIWNSLDDCFTLDGQYQAQHAMSAGVLRPHIDGHGIDALPIFEGLAIFDGVLCFYVLPLHTSSLSFLGSRLLVRIDFTTTFIQLAAIWCA